MEEKLNMIYAKLLDLESAFKEVQNDKKRKELESEEREIKYRIEDLKYIKNKELEYKAEMMSIFRGQPLENKVEEV